MKRKRLISVIVPVYNCEKYLPNCIDSIIGQTYENIEIILIDDGSTDKSGKICDEYATINSKISAIHIKNSGVSNARNVGVRMSKGDYIGFIDADDYIENNMYETLVNNMEKYNADLSMCSYNIVFNNKITFNIQNIDNDILNITNLQTFYNLLLENHYKGFCWNKLYKAEKLKKLTFDNKIHICEDLLLNVEYAQCCSTFVFDKHRLYNYVQRNNSSIHSKISLKTFSVINAYEKILKILQKNNIKCVDKYKKELLFWRIELLHSYDFSDIDKKNYYKETKNLYIEIIKSPNMKYKVKFESVIRFRFHDIFNLARTIKNKFNSKV